MKLFLYTSSLLFTLLNIPSFAQDNNFAPNGNAGIGTGTNMAPYLDAFTILRNNNSGNNGPSISIQNTNPNDPAGNGFNLAWGNFFAGNGVVRGQLVAQYGTGGSPLFSGGSGFYMGTRSTHPVIFMLGSVEKMRITPDGNVGIGTPTPRVKLAVQGQINATKVKVTQTEWPDYVFETSYRLRPLSEVEEYINKYRHLPGIPSAKEVEKDGLDLGDNQAKTLLKVEELTLYLLQQNRLIEELNKKITMLENEVKELKAHN